MIARLHICICLLAPLLFADGGAVQFRKQAGPLSITVFSAPAPLRAGSADLSVLVQTAADSEAVLDATVTLRLSKPGEPSIDIPATRAQATNKLLYAAQPLLPSAGRWQIDVQVSWNGNTFEAPGEITVLPQASPLNSFWPYFALAPVAVLLFLANQWLKQRRRPQPRKD